jgi:hypothetical protein
MGRPTISRVQEYSDRIPWWEGAALGLTALGAFLIAAGPTTVALGGWATALWSAAAVLALGHGRIYGAFARAHPTITGGLTAYAIRGWGLPGRRIAAATAIGYWFAWASVPGVLGRGLGTVIENVAPWTGMRLPQLPPWVYDQAIPLMLIGGFASLQLRGLTAALRTGRYLGLALLGAAAVVVLALWLPVRPAAPIGSPARAARPDLSGWELCAWLYLMCCTGTRRVMRRARWIAWPSS